jgi:hypothetical protein
MCRRVCTGLEGKGANASAETVQQVIAALVSCDLADKENYHDTVAQFVVRIISGVKESTAGDEEIENEIFTAFNSMNDTQRRLLDECEVLGVMSQSKLLSAIRGSLHCITSPRHFLADVLNPSLHGAKSHVATNTFLQAPLTERNLKPRYLEVLRRQWTSRELSNRLIAQLHQNATPLDYPKPEDFDSSPTFFCQQQSVNAKLDVGSGIQTGDKNDVFFAVADAYNTADLVYMPIERTEKYSYSRGAIIGFLIHKQLLTPQSRNLDRRETFQQHANEALVVQWILQVLRSPISVIWKEWFLMHLRTNAVWMPQVSSDKKDFQHMVIVQLLALRCEMGSVRDVVLAAFGRPPPHCTRCNRVYGVIAMMNPPVGEWVDAGYDVKEYAFPYITQDEEAFRKITEQFNPMTSHVVVRGFDKAQISDDLLKWLCEYTFRYPWRFVILVNCDTTMNLPENRDRVTNLIPFKTREMRTITLRIKSENTRWEPLMSSLPQPDSSAFKTTRSCSWSEDVETLLRRVHPSNSDPSDRVLLIHLVSPPGGGKSTLMQDLESRKELGEFVRLDCSDDRLVEEALQALLHKALEGVQSANIVLVADEYHMLPERKKIEFMQSAIGLLPRVKIVLVANRVDSLDKKLLKDMRDAFPLSAKNIKCIEGRISALKVKLVISKTYDYLTEENVQAQAKSFYTFLAALRGLLGDDAVSLRFEEHFPRADKNQRVNNFDFIKKMQDKLIAFGYDSILRILNNFEQISVLVEKQTARLSPEDRRVKIQDLYLSSIRQGSATRLLVFTSMLVPLLMYQDPTMGPNAATTLPCDEALCYRDVVELTGHARRAPASVRLFLWIRYVLSYVNIDLPSTEAPTLFTKLRKLKIIDFPDFPIIESESSLNFSPLHEQKTTYVDYHDLTDLDWIYRTLSRRASVNWAAVARTWAQTPVTDSEKLCAIIELAGPTTVFHAMSPSNVLQLLKRNPTGPFKDTVISSYPIDRVLDESTADESPYFFAAYTDIVMLEPTEGLASRTFDALLLRPRGGREEPGIAAAFLFWVSQHGSLVASVPNKAKQRTETIVRLVSQKSEALNFTAEQHADLWRWKYLAPAAELFDESGQPLIPLARIISIVKGASVHHRLHDKWSPNLKLLHRVMTSQNAMLTEHEASHLLQLGVHKQPNVPSRLIGALLQADPPGWLDKGYQLELLACEARINPCDVNNEARFTLNARRNVIVALRTIKDKGKELKLDYDSITRLYDELQKKKEGAIVVTEGREAAN